MLIEAFPSPPGRCGDFVLVVDCLGQGEFIRIWCTPWAARKQIDVLMNGKDFVWITKNKIQSEDGVTVQCSLLSVVMQHKLTTEESEWPLPEPILGQTLRWLKEHCG